MKNFWSYSKRACCLLFGGHGVVWSGILTVKHLSLLLLCPAPIAGALSDDARLTTVWRLFVAYIGPKSRTERLRKTKIGTEVAHVTCDSDTTFKVKRWKVKVTRPLWLAVQVTILNLSRRQQFIYATAQSEPLPVDLHKITTCTGRGHSVAAALQPHSLLLLLLFWIDAVVKVVLWSSGGSPDEARF